MIDAKITLTPVAIDTSDKGSLWALHQPGQYDSTAPQRALVVKVVRPRSSLRALHLDPVRDSGRLAACEATDRPRMATRQSAVRGQHRGGKQVLAPSLPRMARCAPWSGLATRCSCGLRQWRCPVLHQRTNSKTQARGSPRLAKPPMG